MTIYRQEGGRGTKRNPRCSKFPSLSRKRNSLKRLAPIYELDEDCEESEFSDSKDKRNLDSGRLGKVCLDSNDNCFHENTNIPHGEHWVVNKMRKQQQKYREFGEQDNKETCSYLKRHQGRHVSVTEGNTANQMVFPDFFPPGMHVHCAKNSLPEASKGLYMKIMQCEAELTQERNVSKTNISTGNNSSNKQQNWMQFFG